MKLHAYVAVLRAINVGGNKPVLMANLRTFAEGLGLADVRTLLQSGNLIFKSERRDADAVAELLEANTQQRFGHAIDYFVRDAAQWMTIISDNPFTKEAVDDPGHLLMMCLKNAPKSEGVVALKAAIKGREYFEVVGRNAYFVYPDGVGDSKLTAKVIAVKLGTSGTARNWNTVRKIAALLKDERPQNSHGGVSSAVFYSSRFPCSRAAEMAASAAAPSLMPKKPDSRRGIR